MLVLLVAKLCEIKSQVQELQCRTPVSLPAYVQGTSWTRILPHQRQRNTILLLRHLQGPPQRSQRWTVLCHLADWEQRHLCALTSLDRTWDLVPVPPSLAPRICRMESSRSASSGSSLSLTVSPTQEPEPASAWLETSVPPQQSPLPPLLPPAPPADVPTTSVFTSWLCVVCGPSLLAHPEDSQLKVYFQPPTALGSRILA